MSRATYRLSRTAAGLALDEARRASAQADQAAREARQALADAALHLTVVEWATDVDAAYLAGVTRATIRAWRLRASPPAD